MSPVVNVPLKQNPQGVRPMAWTTGIQGSGNRGARNSRRQHSEGRVGRGLSPGSPLAWRLSEGLRLP